MPAEIRVRREAPEIRDAAAPVSHVEPHRAGRPPVISVPGLDDEAAGLQRLLLRTLDLLEDRLAVAGTTGGHERLHVLVVRELEQEVGVLRRRPADPDVHSGTGAGRRRRVHATRPDPRATPPRFRSSPITFCTLRVSSSSVAP